MDNAATTISPDPDLCAARWAAVLRRDPGSDGLFWYSVSTTGVYCRPSCGARRPLRAHVAFHDTVASAQRAGFRPCLRCRPDSIPPAEARSQMIEAVCRRLDAAVDAGLPTPTLATLAAENGLSPWHFQRLFTATLGVSPHAYATARRAVSARTHLAAGAPVTTALYDAGYGAPSRFYAHATPRLGMTPRAFRAGGSGMDIAYAFGESTLGLVLVAATERGVCAIELGTAQAALIAELQRRFPKARLRPADAAFQDQVAQVVGFIETPAAGLTLPLDIRGTAFQQKVWAALQDIPLGSTISYAELARRIGQPTAVRAVARACATNNISLAIPCHRVIGSDGRLTGYAWGVERKRALLDREGG